MVLPPWTHSAVARDARARCNWLLVVALVLLNLAEARTLGMSQAPVSKPQLVIRVAERVLGAHQDFSGIRLWRRVPGGPGIPASNAFSQRNRAPGSSHLGITWEA